MRVAQVCWLAVLAVADDTCEQREQVSMLQTKDRSSLTRDTNLIDGVDNVAQSFKDAPETQHFLYDVKSVLLANDNPTGKEALLQRASQGENVRKLIQDFQSLPQQDRKELTDAGNSILQKLPSSQKAALVQQVSHELDGAVGQKTRTTEDAAGNKETRTYTPNGQGGHTHVTRRDAKGNVYTETTTRDKNGQLVHYHGHSHVDGQTATQTQSGQNGRPTHGHMHAHDEGSGVGATMSTQNGVPIHAHVSLIETVDNVAQSFNGPEVKQFLDGVKVALHANDPTGKEALLQRASQGENVRKLLQDFQSLPQQDRKELTDAGNSILQKLPVSQKTALVQQVSHELDGAVEQKTKTTEDAAGNKETRTHTRNGRGGHTHVTRRDAKGNVYTETTTHDKNGKLVHNHVHSHQDGQTGTFTQSNTGHGHSHYHNEKNGDTLTMSLQNGMPTHAHAQPR